MARELFERDAVDHAFLAAHASGVEAFRERTAPWTMDRVAAITGLPAAAVARLVDLYATTRPSVVRCGWGLERNRNGTEAVMAVLALPALVNAFGVPGGGYTMSNSAAWGIDGERWRRDARAVDAPREHEPARRGADRHRRRRPSRCCSSTTAMRSSRRPTRTAFCRGCSARICSRSCSIRCAPTRRATPT